MLPANDDVLILVRWLTPPAYHQHRTGIYRAPWEFTLDISPNILIIGSGTIWKQITSVAGQ